MNKKGVELTFNTIAVAVLVFIVLVVVIITFTGIFGEETSFLKELMKDRLKFDFKEDPTTDIAIPLFSFSSLGSIFKKIRTYYEN